MKKKLWIILFIVSLAGPTPLYLLAKGWLNIKNHENRQLAELPRIQEQSIEQLPASLEAWYNDRIPFKNQMVRAKNKMDLALLGESAVGDVTLGKDGWMFYTISSEEVDALADYRRENIYTEKQFDELRASMQAAKEKIEGRGMRFFFFVAPNKESVYGEYMPDKIRQPEGPSRLEAAIPRLQQEGLPVYDLTEALRKEKQRIETEGGGEAALYYKYDTHWNQLGAFVGSQEIAEMLTGTKTELSAVSVVPEVNCSGDMAFMLNLEKEYGDDWTYRIDDYLPEITAECVEGTPGGEFSVFTSNSPNDRTLLVLGDSYSQGLKPYLSKLYRRSVFITVATYEKSILDRFPADDFLCLLVERNQKWFEQMGAVLDQTEPIGGIRQTTDGT